MTVDQFLSAWERSPTPSGRHDRARAGAGWKITCPLHDDRHPSLEVGEGADGKLLLRCFGACGQNTPVYQPVLEAVGLWQKSVNGSGLSDQEIAYPYRDEDGRLLYEVVRFPDKSFRQRRIDARGQPVWGLGETRRVLFGLPELLKTAPGELIAVCEGEKDALNVARAGMAATTCPMGAGKWRQEYTDWLKERLADRRFLILPDNDAAGIAHADEVFQSLKRAGLTVYLANLGELPPKGDVTDWLRADGSLAQLLAMAEPPRHPLSERVISGEKLQHLKLAVPEALVPNLVYRGFSTLIAGDSKLGKSSLLLRMMLAMAVGGWWLDRDRRPENRLPESRVLFLNFEDPLYLTQQRALRMMAPEGLPDNLLTMEPPYGYSLPQIIDWLAAAQEEFALDAVVLDPIAIAAEWEKEEDNAKVALTFKALQRLAAETHLGVLSAHHVSKKPGQFGMNIRGASAIKANVLGYLVLERDHGSIRLAGINKMTGEWDVTLGRDERDYSWWIEESHAGNTRTAQQAAKDEAKADILILLHEEPGQTTEMIAEAFEMPESTCRVYLAELEQAKLIFSHVLPREPGQRGRDRHGWFRYVEGAFGN